METENISITLYELVKATEEPNLSADWFYMRPG